MRTLVIDNEESIRESLVLSIKAFCPQIEEIEEADDIESGLQKILDFKPELVFLDVELNSGTGMDILSKIPKINFNVIFVTAHNKYAIDAFRFSAIDFLLKPINPEELIRSVNKAEKQKTNSNLTAQLNVLKAELQNTTPQDKNIVLSEQDSIHILKSSNIIYCSSEGNYTTFHTNTGESKIVISKNMKVFEEMLSPLGFIRVHTSFLVNINKIEKYDKGEGGFLFVTGGDKIPVSQRKKELLMALFKKM
ncbi:MAG: response regulator transcription factor [Sphingobacteriaceae bacterium]|nr:response regulator transcription factor [Sphingobacteriaceae bacterium]